MSSTEQTNPPRHPDGGSTAPAGPGAAAGKDPDWANGLKKLYDSVVEEPLPDSFQDLLDQLDAKN